MIKDNHYRVDIFFNQKKKTIGINYLLFMTITNMCDLV